MTCNAAAASVTFSSLFYYEGEEFSSLKLEYIFVFGLGASVSGGWFLCENQQ